MDLDLPRRLTAWREAKGLTKQQLAAAAAVTPAAVYQWEATDGSAITPRQETLSRIVDALEITMAEFWGPIPKRRKAS